MANSKLLLIHILSLPFLAISAPGGSHFDVKQQQQNEEEENGPFVGVNIGTDVENLPLGSGLVAFLQLQKIKHVHIYDANRDILKALSGTKIRVIISVPNNQRLAIGSSNTTAASWIDQNVVAYYPLLLRLSSTKPFPPPSSLSFSSFPKPNPL